MKIIGCYREKKQNIVNGMMFCNDCVHKTHIIDCDEKKGTIVSLKEVI